MSRQVLVSETQLAAIEARHGALESEIEKLKATVANLVENINLLRGDRQRIEAANMPPRKPHRNARVTVQEPVGAEA